MRTENPSPTASAVARLRSQAVRASRLALDHPPTLRWAFGLGVLAVLMALGYLLAAPVSPESQYLGGGRRFAADDLIKITHALDAKHIVHREDDQGKIEVRSDRLDEATEVMAKLGVGPISLDDVRAKALISSPWELPSDQEQRSSHARELTYAAMISRLDGIVWAYVTINRSKARAGLRATSNATAFVYLQTEGNREISYKIVQAIQNIIVANEPDLKRNAVSVFDEKGRHYLDANNEAMGAISLTRAHEEELSQEILDQLDWIKGVRVKVQLAPSAASPPAAAPPAPVAPRTSISVNTPLDLGPETPPASAPAAAAPRPTGETGMAKVWVKVPRSFYLKAFPNREPSQEALQPLITRTEKLIQTAVAEVVHGPFEVMTDTIPDGALPSGPLLAPTPPDARRTPWWWVPAGVAGAVAATLLLTLTRVLASRRPEPRPTRAAEGGRVKIDRASEPGPGPSERVRELIRLNPAAAASVLHRWTGQGGTVE